MTPIQMVRLWPYIGIPKESPSRVSWGSRGAFWEPPWESLGVPVGSSTEPGTQSSTATPKSVKSFVLLHKADLQCRLLAAGGHHFRDHLWTLFKSHKDPKLYEPLGDFFRIPCNSLGITFEHLTN